MIRVTDEGALRQVTLDRPDRANSLTAAMLDDLATAVEGAGAARALVITGTGRVFSAGADLDEVRGGDLATSPLWERLSGAIATAPFLTIAALNGTVAGGAMGMVLACDLRLAVPGAQAFYPVMRLGVLPQPSDPGRLVALVGPARARLVLLAGARLAPDEALAAGLFDRIVPPETLLDTARALAADALAAAPAHLAAIKAMIAAAAATA